MTLHATIIRSAREHPDSIAFNYPKGGGWASVTCGEFISMARAASEYLKARGAARGAFVSIVSENRPEWCAFYLGALMCGATAVPVDVRLTPGEIMNIFQHSGAKLVVCSDATEKAVAEAAGGLDMTLLNMDAAALGKPSAIGAEDIEYEDAGEDEVASLLYTSGTTGTPKGVMLTHRNLCSDAEAMAELKELVGPRDNVLSALPLHHTYPFMCSFVLPMFVGAGVTFPAGLKGEELLDAVTSNGVTVFVAVPRMLEIMRDRIYSRFGEMPGALGRLTLSAIKSMGSLREKLDINLARHLFARRFGPQFRFFACGGARLEPQVMRDMEALGFTVVEGYGLTETSPIVAFNPIGRRKPGSVGRAVEGAEIRIENPDDKGVGEITVRGPMVMLGYYRNDEATELALRGGRFHTGDLGYMDPEGYIVVTGRAKEVIVLGSGKNVYPEDVEKHYARIPLIKEMCVLDAGGKLHAVIVPDTDRKGEGDFEESLRAAIKEVSEDIASHMRISGYTISERPLPRTPLGKLRRFMVADIVKGKERVKEADPSLSDETAQRALACLGRLAEEPGPYRSTDDLELDLGLDSLKRLEMVSALEAEFSVKLPEGLASEVRTVGELVEVLRKGESAEGAGEGTPWGEPSEKEKARAGLVRHAWEWPISALAALFLRLLFAVLFRVEVKGAEKIPPPPFILAPNHLSNIDGLVVAAAVPLVVFRRLYFQGYYKYFEGPLKSIFARLSHVISIDPVARLRNALRLSAFVLGQGNGLCIFPEGQRSWDGDLGVFKKGIGILALHGGVPVVPVKIEGTFKALPRGKIMPRSEKVRITFGEPLRPSDMDYAGMPEGADREQYFADVLRERVSGL